MEEFDIFSEKYKPIDRDDSTILFETYGEDWDRVKEANSEGNYVWTVIDADGKLYLTPGVRLVNRLNYVICEIPYEKGCIEEYEY